MSQYRRFYDEPNQENDVDRFNSSLSADSRNRRTPAPGVARATNSEFTLYKRRWLLICVLGFVNVSSAIAWISFAPVADDVATYLNTTEDNVNWLSTVYMVTSIPFGVFAVWLMDTFGLAPVIILGACCNSIGLIVRYLGVLQVFADYRFVVVLVGQGIASLAQPCFLFTPTKVAAIWFPEGQRTIANTVGSTCNPLGILLGLVLSPILVGDSDDVGLLLLVYMIPGVVSGVLAVIVMSYCKNAPPSPPSASAASKHETFFTGVKKLLRIKAFWVLFFVFGAGLAVFNVVVSLIEEVLSPHGYSDEFSSLCGALMIGSGIVGAFISGLYVDRTKKFALVAKTCFALSAVCAVALAVLSSYPNFNVLIAVASSLVGFFGFAQFAVSLELSVETTYPIAEGTTAGFLIMSGQIQGAILMLAADWLSRPMPHSSEDPPPADMTITMLFYAGYIALAACVYILGFHTTYKRLRAEHCNAADQILSFNRRNLGDQPNIIF